jgi:hypothetical protein
MRWCVLTIQPDVGLILYISDILATLDYKLQEEVMLVVQLLSVVISGCHHIVDALETAAVSGDDLVTEKIKTDDVGMPCDRTDSSSTSLLNN